MKTFFTFRISLFLLVGVFFIKESTAQYIAPTGEVVPYTVKSSNFDEQFSWYPQPSVNFNSAPYDDFSYIKRDVSKFINFRLLFPNDFETSAPDETYPIIVMVHGKGEGALGDPLFPLDDPRRFNNNHQLLWGGKNHMDAVQSGEFPGLILFPQSEFGAWNNDPNSPNDFSDLLLELVEKLKQSPEFKIDPLRIYIWGLSNGGGGTVTAIQRRPDLFAAAQPMCGWQNDPNYPTPGLYERMAHMPIRYFHGAKDPLSFNYMSDELKRTNEAGGAGRQEFILDPNADHGVWHDAIKRDDFFSWFLKYNQLSILAFHGKDQVCLDEIKPNNIDLNINVKLGIAPGHKEYQWSYNGTETTNIIFQGTSYHNIMVNKLGKYYVRVKVQGSNEWSMWSEPLEIKPADPIPGPKIATTGSTFFPSPDGVTSVTISMPEGYGNYTYNHGSPGFRTQVISNNFDGYRIGKALQNCWTEWGDTLYVASSATLNMAPPSEITTFPISESKIGIHWKDNTPEDKSFNRGFEIFRSKNGGSLKYVTKTEPGTAYYIDSGLDPNTEYRYEIRAVGMKIVGNTVIRTGRSNTASSLPVFTLTDDEAPSRPRNLVAMSNLDLNSVRLTWQSSTDNVGVTEYIIYRVLNDNTLSSPIGTATETNFEVTGLSESTPYTFVVKAKDQSNNLSEASNQAFVVTDLCGLQYTFYLTDDKVASVDNLLPSQIAGTGIVNNFDIGIRSAHGGGDDHFGFEFVGLLEINQAGTYTFGINSDDGSKLWINNEIVVNNDGLHGDGDMKEGSKYLEVSRHSVKVKYFEKSGNQSLTIKYKGPGISEYILIPDDVLCNYPVLAPPIAPVNLQTSNESMTSIQLQWGHNNSNAYGYELYRGRSEDSNFELIGTTALGVTEFTDTGLEPGTIYYYKAKAIGAEGGSAYSNVVYTNTLEDAEAPDTIDDLEKINHSENSALLYWTAPDDNVRVIGYNIYALTDEDETVLLAKANEKGNTTYVPATGTMSLLSEASEQPIYYVLEGLVSGTSYDIVVTAYDASGNESEISNVASFTTSGVNPLPIELISFTGKVEGNAVKIEWKTASEKDNDFFTIERAVNSKIFEEIGTLDGAGTSIAEIAYTYYDEFPVVGKLFYRLKQTDYNGDFEYSDIIGINYPSVNAAHSIDADNIILYPNPTSSQNIHLKIEGVNIQGVINLKIVDLLGQVQVAHQFDANSLLKGTKISSDRKLTPGIYIVMIEHGNKVNKLKLIINE